MGTSETRSRADASGHGRNGSRLSDQASSLGSGPQKHARGNPAFVSLAIDCAKLADLQMQLLQFDLRDSWGGTWRALLWLAISGASLIAALPVAMFGIAELLRQTWSTSIERALLLVAATVLVLAGLLMYWSGRRLAVATLPLRRSMDEMRANVAWLRRVLDDETGSQ